MILLVCWTCQSKNESKNEETPLTSLEGTTWKLTGIVNVNTGTLKALEPKDCKECYTLSFDTDSTFTTNSASNGLGGNYKVDFHTCTIHIDSFGGTMRGEIGDGHQWWVIFPILRSFSLKKNELVLYYNDEKDYLLFKPLNP